MPRKKKVRIVNVRPEKGIFGPCGVCNGTVRYYDDFGVKCDKCGKLYGISF